MTPAEIRPLGPAPSAPRTVPSQPTALLSLLAALFRTVCAASASPAGLWAPCGPGYVCPVCHCVPSTLPIGPLTGFAFQLGSTPRQEKGSPRSLLPCFCPSLQEPLPAEAMGFSGQPSLPPPPVITTRTRVSHQAAVGWRAPCPPHSPSPSALHSPGLVILKRALVSAQAWQDQDGWPGGGSSGSTPAPSQGPGRGARGATRVAVPSSTSIPLPETPHPQLASLTPAGPVSPRSPLPDPTVCPFPPSAFPRPSLLLAFPFPPPPHSLSPSSPLLCHPLLFSLSPSPSPPSFLLPGLKIINFLGSSSSC